MQYLMLEIEQLEANQWLRWTETHWKDVTVAKILDIGVPLVEREFCLLQNA